MGAARVELSLNVECSCCGKQTQVSLPVQYCGALRCACGSELAVDTETLDRVQALAARFRANLRGGYARGGLYLD